MRGGRRGLGPNMRRSRRGQPYTPDSSREVAASTQPDNTSSNVQTPATVLFGVTSTSSLSGSLPSPSDSIVVRSGQAMSSPVNFSTPTQAKGIWGYTPTPKPDGKVSNATDESSSRGTASDPPLVVESFECPLFIGKHQDLSFEELKLIDYGKGLPSNVAGSGDTVLSSLRPYWINKKSSTMFNDSEPEMHPELLKGPGVEIKVGRDDTALNDVDNPDTYSLPKALLSQYSPYLTAACEKTSSENTCNIIKLKFDNPSIFSLFNLWMYYGRYTASEPLFSGEQNVPTRDVQAWVLGDKLQSVGFKNYAMTRIYQQYETSIVRRAIPTTHFDYVCASTKPGSKLRQFFLDVVGANLSNKSRVVGTSEEWDEVFQKYADARTFILKSVMMAPPGSLSVKPLSVYMESKPTVQLAMHFSKTGTTSNSQMETAKSTIPAKWNLGVPAKKEPTRD